VALAWLLANPAVTAPIIGPRTVEQYNESLRAPDVIERRWNQIIGRRVSTQQGRQVPQSLISGSGKKHRQY